MITDPLPNFFRSLQADRTVSRQSLVATSIYAVQVVFCATLLYAGYRAAGVAMVQWAIVSAVLVLQPAVHESLKASAIRIAANLVGCSLGVIVGVILGEKFWHVLVALVACVFICEQLRLDAALRSACVAVIIVMMHGDRSVIHSSKERATDVVIGSILAVIVQGITDILRRKVFPRAWIHGPLSRAEADAAKTHAPAAEDGNE